MQLIVITPDHTVNEEADIINGLFANGLLTLHIRKSSFAADDYRAYLSGIDKKWYNRIVLHNCYELYGEFNLAGVHLNRFSRTDDNAWKQIEEIAPKSISTSFHSWREIEDAAFPYSYVFISPVFDSISKRGYQANVDLSAVRRIKQNLADQNLYCSPIIGLGGVGVSQINTLHQNSFDGGAMLGAIWQSPKPLDSFTEAMKTINALQGG